MSGIGNAYGKLVNENKKLAAEIAALREDALTPLEASWCIESFPLAADEERALIAKLSRIALRYPTTEVARG